MSVARSIGAIPTRTFGAVAKRTRVALTVLLAGVPGLAACGSSQPAPAPPVVAESPATDASQPLFDKLHALERPEPVLGALPDAAQALLQRRLASLSEADRSLVQEGEDERVLSYPLLHLASGGRSLAVYAQAVDSSALSDEWVGLAQEALPDLAPAKLVEVANELVRRAAQYLLRERAADFAPGRAASVPALRQVAVAGQLLELGEVTALASELRLEVDDAPEALAAAIATRSRRGDVAGAEQLLETLLTKHPSSPWAAVATENVSAAKDAAVPATSLETATAQARALVELEHHARAVKVLNEHGPREPHLAHAAALIRAQLEGGVCPSVLRRNAVLCGAAFETAAEAIGLNAALTAAWQSQKGRDAAAVDHFLGLMFVAPLMYRRAASGEALTAEGFAKILGQIEQHALEAQPVAERFVSMALLARTLRQAVTAAAAASDGQNRNAIEPSLRAELQREALARVSRYDDRWAQAAALAVLAVSLQEDDLSTQLDALRPRLDVRSLPAYASLNLWTALADHDVQRFEDMGDVLVSLNREQPAGDEPKSAWLLTWAEADAHLRGSERALTTLFDLATRLATDDSPLALRLRAALDLAGVEARRGRLAEAQAILSKWVEATPMGPAQQVQQRDTQELLLVAQGYLQVLRGQDAAHRTAAQAALDELLLAVDKEGASPSVHMLLTLWRAEFDVPASPCARGADCRAGALAPRVARVVGARTAALLRNGVVPIGGAEIDISYGQSGEVSPRVAVEVSFPFIEVPRLPGSAEASGSAEGQRQR